MRIFIDLLYTGILIGGVYALFASGLTLSLGVMGVFNVAFGALLTLTAIVTVRISNDVTIGIWVCGICAAVIGAGLSIGVELVAVRPLRLKRLSEDALAYSTLIATLGFLLVYDTIATWETDAQPIRFPDRVFKGHDVHALGISVPSTYYICGITGLIVVAVLWIVVEKTFLGYQLQAVAADSKTAELLGINVGRLSLMTAGVAGALAGVAGVLLGVTLHYVDYQLGDNFLAVGFVAIVVGGIGSIPGTIIGGILIGVGEQLTGYYVGQNWAPLAVAALIVAVLLVRPQGVVGRAQVSRS